MATPDQTTDRQRQWARLGPHGREIAEAVAAMGVRPFIAARDLVEVLQLRKRLSHATGEILTDDGTPAVGVTGAPLNREAFLRRYARTDWDWVSREVQMFPELTTQVQALEASATALRAVTDLKVVEEAHATAMAAFDEKFRAPDGRGTVASEKGRNDYEKRLRADQAVARRAAGNTYRKAVETTKALLAATMEPAGLLPSRAATVAAAGNLSRGERWQLEMIELLERQDLRAYWRESSWRERYDRYKAARDDDEAERGFVRRFETDPLAGADADDAEHGMRVRREVRERQDGRVPQELRDLATRVDAASSDLGLRLLSSAG
jgi:hypothetical protein